MKYSYTRYLFTNFFSDYDDNIDDYRSDFCVCKHEHICSVCGKVINPNDYALIESGLIKDENEEHSVRCYTCVDCLDEWIDAAKSKVKLSGVAVLD